MDIREFSMNKVGFALTLLGMFFALYPIIQDIDDAGFLFFNTFLSIRLFYYLTLSLIGTGIYFYGLDFISPNSFRFARKVGDIFFATGFLAPDILFILWLSTRAIALLKFLETRSPVLYLVFYIFGAIIDLAAIVLLVRFIARRLHRKDIRD